MIRTFINSYKVSYAEGANQFIYFLKRIPLLGKKVPEKLYKKTDIKLILGAIWEILRLFGGFFKKSFYLGIMIILPAYLITGDMSKVQPIFFHILFFLNFILGPLMKSTVFNKYNKKAYNMITLMRADAGDYYLGEMIYRNLTDFVYFILPAVIIGLIIGFSPLRALILIIELIAFRFMGEWLQLFVYDRFKTILVEGNIFNAVLYIGTLVPAYALPAVGLPIDFGPFLFNALAVILILCLGAAAFTYLYKYNEYTPIAKRLLTRDNIFKLGAIKTDMKFADVKLDEKKMSSEDMDSRGYNKKQGYEYLNSIFFKRHRRIMVLPVVRRVVFVAVVFLICGFIVIFVPQNKATMFDQILKSAPLFVFLMYLMSTGERTCRAMFYNCDMSLLRYAYYREGKVILSNFTARLKRVVLLNIMPALAMCLAIFVLVSLGGFLSRLVELMPLFLCILCLACFFSIHHLFMYYVIQPYTAELTVKSPLFKVVNFVVYMISYGCLQIKTSSYYFTGGVIILTVVYMLAALIITYRVAPRTFRLK